MAQHQLNFHQLFTQPRTQLKTRTSHELHDGLKSVSMCEKRMNGQLVSLIREVDHRRLYLDHGYTSLFAYLTKCFGYPDIAAKARIVRSSKTSNDS